MKNSRNQAIVIGGGSEGRAAACLLSRHFPFVTLMEDAASEVEGPLPGNVEVVPLGAVRSIAMDNFGVEVRGVYLRRGGFVPGSLILDARGNSAAPREELLGLVRVNEETDSKAVLARTLEGRAL